MLCSHYFPGHFVIFNCNVLIEEKNNKILPGFLLTTLVASCLTAFQVVHTYEGHQADVHLLLPFGDHLISVDKDNAVIIWDVESEGFHKKTFFTT